MSGYLSARGLSRALSDDAHTQKHSELNKHAFVSSADEGGRVPDIRNTPAKQPIDQSTLPEHDGHDNGAAGVVALAAKTSLTEKSSAPLFDELLTALVGAGHLFFVSNHTCNEISHICHDMTKTQAVRMATCNAASPYLKAMIGNLGETMKNLATEIKTLYDANVAAKADMLKNLQLKVASDTMSQQLLQIKLPVDNLAGATVDNAMADLIPPLCAAISNVVTPQGGHSKPVIHWYFEKLAKCMSSAAGNHLAEQVVEAEELAENLCNFVLDTKTCCSGFVDTKTCNDSPAHSCQFNTMGLFNTKCGELGVNPSAADTWTTQELDACCDVAEDAVKAKKQITQDKDMVREAKLNDIQAHHQNQLAAAQQGH